MDDRMLDKAKEYQKTYKKRRRRKRIGAVLASVVAFVTTYALILPAITAEKTVYCGIEEHVHDENCYIQQLICGQDEEVHVYEEEHVHEEGCMERLQMLTCELEETEEHVHDDSCYTEQIEYICGIEEVEAHAHTDSCYQKETILVCELEGQDIIQEAPEENLEGAAQENQEAAEAAPEEGHVHDETCYESVLTCELEEHTHEQSCFSDPTADLETASDWERTIPAELTGIWADDLIAVAESQLGYAESTRNYEVTEDGKLKGYTRYGEWFGDPYGHWCAMYISFCLHYAGIPETAIPYDSNCQNWVETLTQLDMFVAEDGFIPFPGDLVFFESEQTGVSRHVGIVKEVSEDGTTLKTIEGNAGDQVKYVTYDIHDPDIMGYGLLPMNMEMEEAVPFALGMSIPAGKYGNYNFSYNETKDAFTNDPAYAKYYNSNSPLGVAGSFHVVGFDTVTLNTHTNGNVLAHTLHARANFGTNNYADELTYVQEYMTINSTSASSQNHVLVIGSPNTVTVGGNNDQILINGTKIDKPANIMQDVDTHTTPFIDLAKVQVEMVGISYHLANAENAGVTVNFEDMNNRWIQLDNPDGVGHYNISASQINQITNNPLRLKGFSEGHDGSLIINVDCSGVSVVNMPAAFVYIDGKQQSTAEVIEFSAGKVVWNFINAEGVEINTRQMTGMVIALGATVDINENLNGTVIAEYVNVNAESHRTDFTGEFELTDKEKTDIKFRKVDRENISYYLQGAGFELYEWSDGEYVLTRADIQSGSDGSFTLEGLKYNTAYRLIEVQAPDGYFLDKTPYDFYIPHDNKTIYPLSIPDNYEGSSHTLGHVVTIKNTRNEYEVTTISIEKEWMVNAGIVEKLRAIIAVDLYQKWFSDAERTQSLDHEVLYTPGIIMDSENGWQVSVSNLPEYGLETINGEERLVYYGYYIFEQPVRGFEAEYENNEGDLIDGTITFTNRNTDIYDTTEVSIEKQWYDTNEQLVTDKEGSITVKLYQTMYEDAMFHYKIEGSRVLYDEITISSENGWKATVTELPEHELQIVDGEERMVYYGYSVEEVPEAGYTVSYENNNDIYEGTIVVKNTEVGILKIKKDWVDSNDNPIEMDGEIKVQMYQRVYGDRYYTSYIEERTYQEEVIISAENNWEAIFENLPKHGREMVNGEIRTVYYTYYIEEPVREGYSVSYDNNGGIVEGTITITNKKHAEYRLPETGGMGTNIFIMGGCMMITASLLGYTIKRRRRDGSL